MKSLSESVEYLINKMPFISEAREAGLINTTALSKYLQPHVAGLIGRHYKSTAIAMAINRLPETKSLLLTKSLDRFIRQIKDIIVRSDISDFTYQNSPTLAARQARLLDTINEFKSSPFYSFSRGINETTIVCSNKLSSDIDRIFAQEALVIRRRGLGAITILLPTENLDTYGVYYSILKKLAWQGINIVEVISTSHEITLVVTQSDIKEVISLIMDLGK